MSGADASAQSITLSSLPRQTVKQGLIPAPLSGSSHEVISMEGLCKLESADKSKGACITADAERKHPCLRFDRQQGSCMRRRQTWAHTAQPTLSSRRKTDPLQNPSPTYHAPLWFCFSSICAFSTFWWSRQVFTIRGKTIILLSIPGSRVDRNHRKPEPESLHNDMVHPTSFTQMRILKPEQVVSWITFYQKPLTPALGWTGLLSFQ